MLKLQDMRLAIGEQALLAFDQLAVGAGQIVTLIGPSGAGKSTLLKVIAGTQDAAITVSGQVCFGDQDLLALAPHRRGVGYVDQQPVLFPHLNVQQNLAFGAKGDWDGVARALETARLDHLAKADVATLSGGQAARVALMRTLLSKPRALLLDEPFAALDPELRASLRGFVFDQVVASGLPTLLVTHDAADAQAAQGPVFALENHRLARQV